MAHFNQGYALVVGVANYPNVRPLPQSVLNDARAISAILQDPSRAGYPKDQVRLLLDGEATRQGILEGLAWLADSAGQDATAVFYFSGHGGRITSGKDAGNYLISYDTRLNAIKSTAISSEELTAALNKIQAQKLLVLLDACHAGGTGDTKSGLNPNAGNLINADTKAIDEPDVKRGLDENTYERLQQGEGRVIFASSKSEEVSYVMPNQPNSLFTQVILEAMNGKAKHTGDGYLRFFDLANYIFDQVPARQPKQHPLLKIRDLDANFAVSLFRGGEKSLAVPPEQRSDGQLHVQINQKPRVNASDETALRDFIANNLSVDDLDAICQKVAGALQKDGYKQRFSIDIATSSRKPLVNQAQDVVLWLNRRGKLQYLVNALHEEYPDDIEPLP